jgi:hypothetical protein
MSEVATGFTINARCVATITGSMRLEHRVDLKFTGRSGTVGG